MKKNKFLLSLVLLSSFIFSSCDKRSDNTYTVIWKNYNDEILEVDENVKAGTLPTYDGLTPVKEEDDLYRYEFNGWEPEIKEVTANISYKATFTSIEKQVETYTITWVNYDDTVLEVDENVSKGTLPTYDGSTPTRDSDSECDYEFNGWDPEIKEVDSNQTYKAKYKKNYKINIDSSPSFISATNRIEYGYYPQTNINDETLINNIKNNGTILSNGYYYFNNKLYTSLVAKTYPGGEYDFANGDTISDDNEYWFSVDKISWIILKDNNDDTYYLMSEYLLDTSLFYSNYDDRNINDQIIHSNNYLYSDLRNNLNNNFYDSFFNLCDDYLLEMDVGDNNFDKLSVLSKDELLDTSLGFEADETSISGTRTSKVTDYALARGAWASHGKDQTSINKNPYEYNGMYWTRTSSSDFNHASYVVNSAGYLSEYVVDRTSISIRPVISLNYKF